MSTVASPALFCVAALRSYLDEIDFHGIYKYLSTIAMYSLSPSVFNEHRAKYLDAFDAQILDDVRDWSVAQTLTTCRPCVQSSLSGREREIAEILTDAGLLQFADGKYRNAGRQLISVRDRYLFIDASIHFTADRVHDIYIGPDTYLLLHYLAGDRLPRRGRALDLCSGTGIIGLAMSRFCDRVVSTDIGAAPLELIALNRAVNGLEHAIEIRAEDLRHTLGDGERFDLIVCNPPFVAAPPELPSPLYAQGAGADGLGYLRLLIESARTKLERGGEGLFVADLPGDVNRPYFFDELESAAESHGLFIEAFVDNRIDGEAQIAPFAAFLQRVHPHVPLSDIEARVTRFIRDELRGDFYYLTTIRVRRSERPRLRIFNRYRIRDFDAFFRSLF